MASNKDEIVRNILDGQDRSVGARVFRAATFLPGALFALVLRARNYAYDRRLFRVARTPRPTISVGNITLGGVGKTPLVACIAEMLLERGIKPGLVSRGYKAKEQAELFKGRKFEPPGLDPDAVRKFAQFLVYNDEARELAARLPNVPHFLGAERASVANALLRARPDLDAIIFDDAFQRRSVARDLDVVVLDALNPFGGGRVVPAGGLREPISSLARADAIVLNRADLISRADREELRRRVQRCAPRAIWCEIAQSPKAFKARANDADGAQSVQTLSMQDAANFLRGKRALAFCGLGAPMGFHKTLERVGVNVDAFETFPDHCAYGRAEYARLARLAAERRVDFAVASMKDFVKFDGSEPIGVPVLALEVGVEFISGKDEFVELVLSRVVSQPR